MRYQLHALICIRRGAILANQFRLKMYQDGGMHELGSSRICSGGNIHFLKLRATITYNERH